jgi:hypothetical protein
MAAVLLAGALCIHAIAGQFNFPVPPAEMGHFEIEQEPFAMVCLCGETTSGGVGFAK